MVLPVRLTVHDSAYALDGGTTRLRATDEAGRDHTVLLVQHAFPEASSSLADIPGRLYFDGELVPMRSGLESSMLALLRAAEVRFSRPLAEHGDRIQLSPKALILGEDIRRFLTRDPEENIRVWLAEVVRFVESEEYLWFAEQVEQAADDTRYDVWVAWDQGNRKQVIVRLRQVLGVGLQTAREILEQATPVARGLSALEVSRLSKRYREAGLSLRVQPEFRWRLAYEQPGTSVTE